MKTFDLGSMYACLSVCVHLRNCGGRGGGSGGVGGRGGGSGGGDDGSGIGGGHSIFWDDPLPTDNAIIVFIEKALQMDLRTDRSTYIRLDLRTYGRTDGRTYRWTDGQTLL